MSVEISQEMADDEFDRWAVAMGLDGKLDPTDMDMEDKKSLFESKRVITAAIRCGTLTVDDEGRFVYDPKLSGGEPIVFNEPTGADLMAMDRARAGHSVSKMFKTLSGMTQQPEVRFSKMKGRDISVCQAIFALFLG